MAEKLARFVSHSITKEPTDASVNHNESQKLGPWSCFVWFVICVRYEVSFYDHTYAKKSVCATSEHNG